MSSERESGITDLPLASWKSKSLFIWSNDFFHISTVDSEMIIRLCQFTLEQGNNDLTTMNSRVRLKGPGIDAIKFKVSS